ncbi:helix-turn-helix domain-containing protein [Niabella sp. CJ426]|uniref:helix-turn-helix domain-containing protein n=1 Tax=Niabella sp. CJ426 TaxID=3393740 RepID=UPI003CFD8F90
MDRSEFGKRLKAVRSNVLKMSQGELATELGVIQPLVSRLENGLGGTIELLFEIVAYFYQKGYPAYSLFYKDFNIEEFKAVSHTKLPKKIAANVGEGLTELKSFLTAALENTQSIETLLKLEKK